MTTQPEVLREGVPVMFSGPYYVKQYDLEAAIVAGLRVHSLHDVESLRERYVVFDFSGAYWFDLGALLWFVSLLYRLRVNGNEIQIRFPEPVDDKSEKLWDFLIRWRFFETLAACVDDPVNLLSPAQLVHMSRASRYAPSTLIDESGKRTVAHTARLLEMTTYRAQSASRQPVSPFEAFLQKYGDKILIQALASTCGWNVEATHALVQCVIFEGVRNAVLHAQGSYAIVSMRVDNKNVAIAISDNGIGIPEALRGAFRRGGKKLELANLTDAELIKLFTEPQMVLDSRELMESDLIKLAVERGISSADGHGGMGLYYLKSVVLERGGELRIRSGRAAVDFSQNNTLERNDLLPSTGTMLRILTPRRV